ncbi:MAG: copper transporter [Actinomycetaceae bacterium]|nr:copper transporter [Actinomycetaceae bacterium]
MIDFRYHLVSLMAVLVALTIGVILGAGPLQGPLSETLTGQVDKLTQRQAELTDTNEQLKKQIASNEEFLAGVGIHAVAGTLDKVPVALVRTADASDAAVDKAGAYLEAAGATIVTQTRLEPAVFDEKAAGTRQAVAKRLAGYLGDAAGASAHDDDVLVTGIIHALTVADDNTQVIRDLLAAEDAGMLKGSYGNDPAEAIVVVTATSADLGKPTGADKDTAVVDALARGLGAHAGGGVMFGDALDNKDVLSIVRHNSIDVTSVDGIASERGLITLPLALHATRAGTKAAYGTGIGANQGVPEIGAAS